ncbi:uncharacterized protein LOC128638161 isoform X2 [Bombina bombina]|uniref:uncharacterized protein LOC128638161 isoform X2 n=1 Tax=Bombina bombina TaxID=8345 RepID=UPI00235A86FB|nr:uncharacterized protein LOC128638161 isoform X2 [Bombina bombina]
MVGNKNLLNGQWKVISKLTYNASYEDHGKQIMCTATYPNGQSYMTQDILDIEYAPKGVHIVSSKTKDDYIELICTFLSSRPNVTGYIWFIDDIFIHNYTKQILKLENLQTNSGKYYCVAHNKVGLTKSSSLQINITDKQKEIAQSGTLQILIILAAIIFLIMAIILLYFCIRKRKFCITSKGNNNNQDTQSSDAVYTELMKRETSSEYAQLKLEKHLLVPEKRMDINRNLEYENLGEQI